MSADITLTGNKVRFVRLTQQEYAAIATKDADTLYFITDSTEHPIYRGSERLSTYGVATQSAAGLLSAADKTKLDGLNKGVANGVAALGADGKVPSGQLPSYVDDVLEFATKSAFPATGESGKIYVDLSTNRVYRWSGSTYIEIAADRLELGETSTTAYRGDRGKIAYDHSQAAHARTDATKTEASSTNGNIKINGNETTVYTHPSGTNPHGTTKADVGLGNVGNFKAVSTEASQGLTSTEQANARANIGAGTGSSNLALGETSSTAYRGDRGKTAYDHSQSTHARTDATKVEASETNGNILVNGAETTVYTHPSGTNPHGTTKSDVGLGNVGNFKAVSTVASQGLSSTEQSNARANIGAGTSNLSLGETSSTAYRGDRGKTAYDHSQTAHARTDATKTEASETNGNIKINGTETTVYTHPAGTNPHGTTKSDVGLGNVGNFKAVSTVASQGLTSTEQSNARANIGAGTGNSNLALGETSSTAYRGDRGKTAYDHSQATHARTDATATSASSTNGNIKINGTETTVYTHPTATAADAAAVKVGKDSAGHVVLGSALSKSDVGLGNVGNFKAVSTAASQGLSSTEQANARANIGAGTGSSNLTLGETSSTAYRGDRGKAAYDHSQTAHAPSDANKVEASTTNGNIKIAGTETTVYTHPSGTNPHGTTKSDVGLGNVGNFKAVSTVASQGLTSTEKSNARANIGAGTGNGTITGITMNGASKGTSGVVNLGTVITSHQSLANYATKTYVDDAIPTVDQTYNATSANAQSGVAVASAIAALPEPMIFKGSLGTGGTITKLPTASSSNEGFVYKVITAGTYASQTADVGDTFISDGSSWVLIPSGDEPSGTVTSVGTGSGLSGGPITSSGTVSLATAYGDTVNPYGSKTANRVLAAPNGSNGKPSFRALVAADIPSITKSKISDFPSSMPASDVSAWAKARTKPSYTANEVGAQPTLVSGTNIKTINGTSLLGSGDLEVGGTSYFYKKDESTYTTSSGSTTTIPVGISGFRSTDILMVDVNGLNLVQGTDYTVSGTNIVLTSPITHAGAVVHFTAMRIAEVTPQDYAAIKGDKGDSAYTAGTGIKIENGVISLDLQQAESQTF